MNKCDTVEKKKEVAEVERKAAVSNLGSEGLWWNMVSELRQGVTNLKQKSKGWGWYWGEFRKSLMKTWLDEDGLFG